MKQFLRSRSLLLISILFTFALVQLGCGSHGGNTPASSNGGNSGGGSQASPATPFSLNLVNSDQALHAMGMKTSVFGALPAPDNVRVVIRTFGTVTEMGQTCSYDEFGEIIPGSCVDVPIQVQTETYRDIQDVPYSGASVTVGIPQGTGYTLDNITSKLTPSSTNDILRYGRLTGVTVAPGASATVTMTPLSGILNMTVADQVTSKGDFIVTLDNVTPVSQIYQMVMSFGTGTPSVVSNSTNTCTFTAPVSYTTGTVYLQGKFTLDPSLLNKDESPAHWSRLFPLAAYNEQVYSEMNPLIVVTLPGI